MNSAFIRVWMHACVSERGGEGTNRNEEKPERERESSMRAGERGQIEGMETLRGEEARRETEK